MNPQWLGDSFDIVKRFFFCILHSAGYMVFVEPMGTDNWNTIEGDYYKLLGGRPRQASTPTDGKTALFFDPDKGIGRRKTREHVTMRTIVSELDTYNVVFSFDQSFSRSDSPQAQMKTKLRELRSKGGHGFYYDSHARFLFASNAQGEAVEVRNLLLATGLPQARLYWP